MKKAILYILLGSYSMLMLKPVMPYISDTVAHLFWYSKHMATVHYVNGKFHVHKAVMEEEKRNGSDKNPFAEKKEQSQDEYLISQLYTLTSRHTIINGYHTFYNFPVFSFYLNTDSPPPKA